MKTRNIIFAILFAGIYCNLYAQQETGKRIRQVGINFSSLNAFGIHYKAGNEKTLFRMSLATMDFGSWDVNPGNLSPQKNFNAGIRLGFERHVPVSGHFDFIWGVEGGFAVNYVKYTDISTYYLQTWSMVPSADVVLGINYTFADHFVVGAEITPAFEYVYQRSKDYNDEKYRKTAAYFHFGFDSSVAALTLAYRFGK